jgi:hypothetical protein
MYVYAVYVRLGFKQLILDGALLGLAKGTADACYEAVDTDASGCVSFREVWVWFLHQARMKKKGSVNPLLSQIVPAKDRALMALMKRFGNSDGNSAKSKSSKDAAAFDIHDTDW